MGKACRQGRFAGKSFAGKGLRRRVAGTLGLTIAVPAS
jgi:hypothetical protein